MIRKIVAVWVSVAMLFGFIVIVDVVTDFTPSVRATTLYVNTTGSGGAYTSIQDAINASSDGDTVFVYSGTYYENVVVNKTINLTGEDKDTTIINGSSNKDVINVSVDWVNVTGFTLTWSASFKAGIFINSNYNNISHNNVFLNRYGIHLVSSNFNNIYHNNASNNQYGIHIVTSYYNNITHNIASKNLYGISLEESSNNNITHNNPYNNSQVAIFIVSSSYNNITKNTVRGHKTKMANNDGIVLFPSSSNNNIRNNNISDSFYGIYLSSNSNSNNITGNNVSRNKNEGVLLLRSNRNHIMNNIIMENPGNGINIAYSNNNSITNNNISNNNQSGIVLYDITTESETIYNIIRKNEISSNSEHGIFCRYANFNNISYNNISKNLNDGIYFYISSNNNITGNEVYSNDNYGINLSSSSYNNISQNNISNGGTGIRLDESSDNIIMRNNMSSNIGIGIFLWIWSNNNTISDNEVSSNNNGIYINPSDGNIVSGNHVSDNGVGIIIYSTTNSKINENNIVFNGMAGIYSWYSSNASISKNNISSNALNGIYFVGTTFTTIENNSISNNYWGTYIDSTNNITIMNNTLVKDGVIIVGSTISHFNSHTILNDNIVNGDPLYYYKDSKGLDIDGLQFGQLIFANCTDVRSSNLEISNADIGIQMGFCKDSTINENNLSSNDAFGSFLQYSTNITVTRNTKSDNHVGIQIEYSDNIIVTENTISLNRWSGITFSHSDNISITANSITNNNHGIMLYYSSETTISGNNAYLNNESGFYIWQSENITTISNNIESNNEYGIYLRSSNNVMIYHNNLINNTNQAYDDMGNENSWDNGYPSGGNYWSDYIGFDFFSGPDQDISGSDGIGDTNYSIDTNSVDNYPLMVPWRITPSVTIDELRITYAPNGTEADDLYLNVGNEITFYASGYNNSIGYVGLLDVNWSQSLTIGNFSNIIGNSTTFTAGISEGTTTITGTNSTLGLSDSFNLSINAPVADYIEIHDSPDGSGNIVDTMVFNIQDNYTLYAAGFNNTVGYIGDVDVDWTISPPSGVGTVIAGPNKRTTFTAIGVGTCIVTATYSPTVSSSTGLFTVEEVEPVVSYILIRDTPGGSGNVINTRTYGVFDDDMFYAAAYDSGDNYIMDVEVSWSTSSSSVGAIDTTLGIATNFTAQQVIIDRTCTITATYVSLTPVSTGDLTVLAPTVDEIRIVNTSGVGTTVIADQTVIVSIEITGYAASFNDTISYLGDVLVSWSVVNTLGATATTFPTTGLSSEFDAELTGGTATWTADYNGIIDTVVFTITPPTIDYIIIRDAPNDGGFEVTTDFFYGGDKATYYAAAYNDTADYLYDVVVTWASDDTTVGQVTSPGNSTTFTAQAVTATGTCTVTAAYSAAITDSTGLITVSMVVTAPDPPAKPTILVTGSDSIQLTWIPNTEPNIAGYIVYRRESSNDQWIPVGLVTDYDTTSYTDEGLEPDTKYYYVITAVNDEGFESDISLEVSATTADEKGPPDVVKPRDDEEVSLSDYWWVFLIIALVIGSLIIGFLLFRRQPPIIQ